MSLFGGNADIKYPLDAFHEEDFSNALILDLSLAIPAGFDPVLAAFRSSLGYIYLSIEDRSTGIPLACVLVQNPVLGRVYSLDMSVDGFGWIVLGPRATQGDAFFSGPIEIGIDPEAVIEVQPRTDAVTFTGTINGADMWIKNVLQIVTESDLLTLSVEGDSAIIARNDDVLSQQDRIDLIDSEAGVNADVIFTIDGVQPDVNGNIDIVVSGCTGPCLDTHSMKLPRGDAGAGDQEELPLDTFNPAPVVPGDPCGDSSASAEPEASEDGYDGCHDLEPVPIKDRNNDNEIGSILIHQDESITPSTSSTVP